MRKLPLLLIPLLTSSLFAQTTRPHFTIGPTTTLVDGPLIPDGTINYIPAINKAIGEGVRNEDNAAIFLLVLGKGKDKPKYFHALGIDPPLGPPPAFDYLESFLARKHNQNPLDIPIEESIKQSYMALDLCEHPWKLEDHPDAADWLKESAAAILLIENACEKQTFFMPFASEKTPPSYLDGIPDTLFAPCAAKMLACRAMSRAGGGDLDGALKDLQRIQKLARFLDQEGVSFIRFDAMMVEMTASKAYAGLATSGLLTADQLQRVKQQFLTLPPLRADNDKIDQVEELSALDVMMSCIRGDSQRLMQLLAWDFSQSSKIDLGDWNNPDWDAALNEIIMQFDRIRAAPSKSLDDELKDVEAEAADGSTPNTMPELEDGKLKSKVPGIEAFLKMRPGESRDAFSRRITRWLIGTSPDDKKRVLLLNKRERAVRDLALLAFDLAAYRTAHGHFPETLADLGSPPPQDPFADQPLQYTRENDQFILKSVGINKDGLTLRSAPQYP